MIAEINLVLSLMICALAAYIGWSHYREHGFRHSFSLVGLVVLALAAVTVLTSAPAVFDIDREPLRFAAAFLRGIAFVLLAAYALFRWEERP